MNFKQYYQKHVLKESPMRLGMTSEDILDNDALNQQEALELIEFDQPIDQIKLGGNVELSVYRTEFESTIEYFVNKTPLIVSYFMYKMDGDNMQMSGVWNRKMSKGMCFHLFFEYYLPKVKSITSDNKHTTQGENFWKRLVKEAEKRGKTVKAVIKNNEEVDVDNLDKFWGSLPHFFEYKLRVYN
jgi:hypothetical protein